MSYELRDAVQDTLNTSNLATPEDVADKVAENVPARHVRDALRAALPTYVRIMMGRRRSTNVILGGTKPQSQGNSAKSPKVQGVKAQWHAALRDRVHVDGDWKLLGECTYFDLVYAAEEREQLAKSNQVLAERYRILATKLTEHGVSHVSELPVDVFGE